MVWFQRVWLAILLAIAGGGPLPLWLHHLQCHCSSDNAHCDAQSHQCTHHGHATHAHASGEQAPASPDAKKTGSGSARSTGDEHGDCAACYCLSQLSVRPPLQTVAISSSCVFLRASAADRLLELDLLAAYSSRAPPAI